MNTSSRTVKRKGKIKLWHGLAIFSPHPSNIFSVSVYDMVPQCSIIDSLKMYKIFGEVIQFIENTMHDWRAGLTTGGKKLS